LFIHFIHVLVSDLLSNGGDVSLKLLDLSIKTLLSLLLELLDVGLEVGLLPLGSISRGPLGGEGSAYSSAIIIT